MPQWGPHAHGVVRKGRSSSSTDATQPWNGADRTRRVAAALRPADPGQHVACRRATAQCNRGGEGGWCYSRPPAGDERRFRGLPSPPAVAPDALSGSGHWGLALGLALTGPVTLHLCSSAPVPRHGNRSFPSWRSTASAEAEAHGGAETDKHNPSWGNFIIFSNSSHRVF